MPRILLLAVAMLGGCATPHVGHEPSLQPRAAEAIEPRVPIPEAVPSGPVDPALARQLGTLLARARAGVPAFEAREAVAARLAAQAGPMASESWVAAQQALSLLVEQFGVTSRAAADIDQLAADRLDQQRWIRPADREAIERASIQLAAISAPQASAIDRLSQRLAR
ncbi:MAG TPA: hypothetical protein VNA29_07385 [Sphingomicrobium sp.]|nr:hypothetical protein [Sphingomicrobium sp.]